MDATHPKSPALRLFAAIALVLSIWMAGCSSVPGLSMVSDAMDLQKLSTDNPLDLKDEDVQAILQKPIPEPPGMSHDIGQLRRAAAAFALGDLPLMRQLMVEARKSVTNDEMLKNLLALGVTAEALHGNYQRALRDAGDLELRTQAVAQRAKRPVLTSLNDIDAIYRYVEMAYAVGDFALAERVRKQYLEEIIQNPNAIPPAKVLARLRNSLVEGRLTAFRGDLDAGYERIRKGQEQYLREYANLRDRGPLESQHQSRLRDVYLALGQIALAQGRFSQAMLHLTSMRSNLLAADRLERPDASTYYVLEAIYWGSLGEYERALRAVDARWTVIPPRWHGLSSIKTPQLTQRAGLLASMGRWDDAWRDITQLSERDLGEEGAQRDYAVATRALIASVLGKSDPSIDTFLALEKKYRQWRGSDISAAYFAGKTMVHVELARGDQKDHHLAQAVAAGRELSHALHAKLARGGGRESNIGPTLLRRAKESYLMAASAMVGRNGVGMEDVLDALQLSQLNELDMDVSSAAARLGSQQGVPAAKLRELQDLQQKARSTQARVTEYSRVLDADEKKLGTYVSEANQASAKLDRMLSELRTSAPQLAQAFGSGGKPVAAGQLQQRLSGTEGLLVLVPMPTGTFALFASKGVTEQRLLPADTQKVEALVNRIRRSVTFSAAGAPPFDTDAARSLYSELFSWLDKRIRNVKSLTVSASGPLGSIPFGLLIQSGGAEGNDTSLAEQPWLIRSMAVTHAPTLARWLVVSDPKARSTASGFLAWADPDFSGRQTTGGLPNVRGAVRLDSGPAPSPAASEPKTLANALPRLPETADEALGVAKVLGGSSQDVLLSGAATRNSVLERSGSGELARKGVLMFATHGLAPADIPGLTQPALAMAQEAPGKGPSLLQLDDVVGLRLNAEWVVLSACNTASADRVGGDPLSGLARGFFFAGARGMLVTHWEVETRSAAEITRRTFEHYVRDRNLSRAQALQRTAIDMIDSGSGLPEAWSHPAYWAPYALVGNGRRGTAQR